MPPSIINKKGAVLPAVYCSLLSVPMCFEEICEQSHHQLCSVGRHWNHLIPLFLILASDSLLLHHCFSLARRPGEDGWHLHFGLLNSAVPCLGSLVIYCSCLDVLCFAAGFLCVRYRWREDFWHSLCLISKIPKYNSELYIYDLYSSIPFEVEFNKTEKKENAVYYSLKNHKY